MEKTKKDQMMNPSRKLRKERKGQRKKPPSPPFFPFRERGGVKLIITTYTLNMWILQTHSG